MKSTLKIGVLASSKATDLQAIIDAIRHKKLGAEIVALISDKKDAYALARAKAQGIAAIFLDPKQFTTIEDKEKRREAYDREAVKILESHGADLILLIGYMRIISPYFVKKYPNRIMNIHPSLLPEFAGGMDLNVHEEVLKAKKEVTGCTLHFVSEGVDEGPIILQKKVKIEKNDTPDSLKEKVQEAEQEILVKAIQLYSEGKISVKGNVVEIRQ